MGFRFRLIVFFCILGNFIQAQSWKDITNDYIANPSFEEYSSCPEDASGFPGPLWIESAIGWYFPTQGTSDYFNICTNLPSSVGVPNSILMVFQNPFHGKGFCGFFPYELFSGGVYSEYIQTKLLKPLNPHKKYMFSMRINRSNGFNVSVKNIGAHFHYDSIIDYSTYLPLELNPTVLNNTGFLNDTLNWTQIKGEFISIGNEEYLTIGWYGNRDSSDFLKYFFIPPIIDSITGDSLYVPSVYYAVDSLKLFELDYKMDSFDFNIITPNNDGLNDNFDFSIYNEIEQLEFFVYNRWGNLVFNSTEKNLKWAGTNQNSLLLSNGVYYYLIRVYTKEGLLIEKKNIITINY